MKAISLVVVALLVVTSIIIYQRANILIYAMTSTELPQLLDPRDEGDGAVWFDDYYTIHKFDESTFAIGETRYYQLNFNYLMLGDSRAVVFDAGTGTRIEDNSPAVTQHQVIKVELIISRLTYRKCTLIEFVNRVVIIKPNSPISLITRIEQLG